MAHEMFRLDASELVRCHNIEFEIWSKISKFESEFFVKNFLENKIPTLEKKKPDFETISDIKNKVPTEKSYKKDIIFPRLISKEDINDDLILRITNTARQAREFYDASSNLPLLSKPILLMYTLEKLAELLALTIFDMNVLKKYTHGLTTSKTDSLVVQTKVNGLFSIFHDCISFFPDVYLNGYQFALQDLLRLDKRNQFQDFTLIKYIDVFSFLKGDNNVNFRLNIKEHISNQDIEIPELDREFMFTFTVSTLARYKVNEWSKIMMAKDTDIILQIQDYLNTVQLIFPNLILDYLFDKKFIFVPFSYFEKKDIERIYDDKVR